MKPRHLDPSRWAQRLAPLSFSLEQLLLYGEMPPGPRVAIVGTRRPLDAHRRSAYELAAFLAARGVVVVSGGAQGIDTAAHRGALDVGGRTLIVAPSTLERPAPPENADLFREVVEQGGAYLTAAPVGRGADRVQFFRRNELLVALSHVVVLGQAPVRSGALNAVAHARRRGVPRFVLPCCYGSSSKGSEIEVERRGARLLWRPAPVLEQLQALGTFDNPVFWAAMARHAMGGPFRARSAQDRSFEDREGREREGREREVSDGSTADPSSRSRDARAQPDGGRPEAMPVIASLAAGARTVDEVCQRTGLSAQLAQHEITMLTLQGLVFEDSQGLLRLTGAGSRQPSAGP